MKNISAKHKTSIVNILLLLVVVFFIFNMLISPAKYIDVALDGISAWAFNVLPSVFPFMFFTRILTAIDSTKIISKPFKRFSYALYKTPPISIYAFLMAIISGYPVGTKITADLYMQGNISREETMRMTSFCSTSGPMFIIGAVGVGMFKSAMVGYILFFAHVVGAMLNGLLFRNIKSKDSFKSMDNKTTQTTLNISDVIQSSVQAILAVGGIITIFFIIIETLSPILSIFPLPIRALLEGMIEITKGSLSLSSLTSLKLSVPLCSFVISFGGISTLLQSLTMLSKVDIPVRLFALQKLTHGLFSLIVALPFIFLL